MERAATVPEKLGLDGSEAFGIVPVSWLAATVPMKLEAVTVPSTSSAGAGLILPMPTRPLLTVWLPVKAFPPARKATFALKRASAKVPLVIFDASRSGIWLAARRQSWPPSLRHPPARPSSLRRKPVDSAPPRHLRA